MEEKYGYSDCELRYIDQGYDLERAKEVCASSEGRSSDEGDDEFEYWGEV
jgi:hypothetical protein